MRLLSAATSRRIVSSVFRYAALSMAITLEICAVSSGAQAASADSKPADAKPAQSRPKADTYETLYLTNGLQQNDLNEIQSAMRNMLPMVKIYGVPSQHSLSVWGTAEELALAHRILADLDKKKSIYRLTYTLTGFDGGNRGKTQSFALVAVAGERAELKQGTRVPLVTGNSDAGANQTNTQVQYVDLGLNIDATADGYADGVRLRTKVEQSSVAEEKSGVGAQDPVIRQTRLETTSILTAGKAVVLGTMALPGEIAGDGRHLEVSVVAEGVK